VRGGLGPQGGRSPSGPRAGGGGGGTRVGGRRPRGSPKPRVSTQYSAGEWPGYPNYFEETCRGEVPRCFRPTSSRAPRTAGLQRHERQRRPGRVAGPSEGARMSTTPNKGNRQSLPKTARATPASRADSDEVVQLIDAARPGIRL